MKISYNWLKQYIDLAISPEELSPILTDLGLEVSSLTKFESIEGGLEGLVIGEVKECVQHPNADRLSLTKVDVGEENLLDIVCGAPNVATGQKVVVAMVGTTIYGLDEPLTLKKTKIRGEVSEGMICAEDEIGLGESHEGIMVLPNEVETGTLAADYFNIETDYVFEIDLTPNRIDAASHIGVARDLAAYFSKTKAITYKKPEINLNIPQNKPSISIEIENTEACPRYMGLHIRNIKVEASPDWLQNKLKAIGLKPINNIVDIGNYVLFETGQPLHMFDAAHIKGNRVIIKTMPQNTEFITLDEVSRKLSDKDLMICNADEAMCIAGVFGGLDSGISESTNSVFIESAYFNPSWVRKTAKRHGLSTDASFRFERGVDIEMAPYALLRAAQLITEIANGEILSEIEDVYPNKFKPVEVNCSFNNFDRLIGETLPKELIISILKSLEFEILDINDEGFKAIVPLYRVDVTREADIIEEFLRVYGFNTVALPSKMTSSLSYTTKPDPDIVRENIAAMLSGMGFAEIMCTSFTSKEYFDKFPVEENSVAVHNALSQDLNCMRPDMLFGGLESIAHNLNFRNSDMKLYEFGRIYHLYPESEEKPGSRYREINSLGIWLSGNLRKKQWNDTERKAEFFTLKAYIEAVLKKSGIKISDLNIKTFDSNSLSNVIAYYFKDRFLAFGGNVRSDVLKYMDIEQEVFYARIDMDAVLKTIRKHKTQFQAIPKFPKVERDLALLIDESIDFESIKKLAFSSDRKLLQSVELFDVYQGKNLPEGKKSYAIRFVLQDFEKTLKDKEIDKLMNKLIQTFVNKLGAQLR